MTDWLKVAILSVGALIGAFTLAFSAFVLYFGETIYSFASISTIVGIFAPIFINFTVSSFLCLIFLYVVRFNFATMMVGDKLIDNAIASARHSIEGDRRIVRYIIFAIALTWKSLGFYRDEESSNLVFDDQSFTRTYATYLLAVSVTLVFFIGYLNFINVIIYISIIFISVTTSYIIRSFLRNEEFNLTSVGHGLPGFHFANVHLYISVIVFSFGLFRADYLSRGQPEVSILTEQGAVVARIIGYTNDGLIAFRDERIVYIPDRTLLQISFGQSPGNVREWFVFRK